MSYLRQVRKLNARRAQKTRGERGRTGKGVSVDTRDLRESELYKRRFGEKESSWWWLLIVALCCVLAVFGVRHYFTSNYGGVVVDGASMDKTLADGQQLLMEYVDDGREAKRGDIIVLDVSKHPEIIEYNRTHPKDQVSFLIKRLIAIEGDKVKCKDGQISICYVGTSEWVNLNEPYAYYKISREIYDFAEYAVGENEIFFLGDNRNISMDSRYKEGYSHLKDSLYTFDEIYGIVPDWAVKYRKFFDFLLF